MIELKVPRKKLVKEMNNLILDNQASEIRLLLFKLRKTIPSLYRDIQSLLQKNKIHISQSTFKNMLMDSNNQNYDWEKRLKVINTIFEYLNPEKIEVAYQGIKQLRNKRIRDIMELLESDCEDKREYQPIEVLMHEMESIPKDMKVFWESGRGE
jgi:hypothetical protein